MTHNSILINVEVDEDMFEKALHEYPNMSSDDKALLLLYLGGLVAKEILELDY